MLFCLFKYVYQHADMFSNLTPELPPQFHVCLLCLLQNRSKYDRL